MTSPSVRTLVGLVVNTVLDHPTSLALVHWLVAHDAAEVPAESTPHGRA
jgi:hypothetical protein